jgi:hypothetical protein
MAFLLILIVGALLACGKSTSATNAPTSATTPTAAPKATILFEKSNQAGSLPLNKSASFQASGPLHLSYSCLHDLKDGTDVQLNILPVDDEGQVDTSTRKMWMVRMSCPDVGTDTFDAQKGAYRMTASASGDAGWSMKVEEMRQ